MVTKIFLQPNKSFQRISHYKSERSRLLQLLYPSASTNIGKVVFKEGANKGIVVRLSKDQIFIGFDKTFLNSRPNLNKDLTTKFKSLSNHMEYKIYEKSLVCIQLNKNSFEDTRIGIKQRAALHVLTLEPCLTQIRTL
ncbi:hypothetical protein ES711_08660 [Gelidibacter salicanalis]|uniref:Uncharacterized protein n=1 Tax=Gelidibacter salicanalis TaxID=291193 RepID=A0A5C7ALY4_9FLAO|nr:hypothetical protein [Gelidibacter salicanalis]TXE08563.1 hypothetical protein ES711_08660 [Gelidibacter salicanalis]